MHTETPMYEFQFHKVRLKAIAILSAVLTWLFQFHKVRLKGFSPILARVATSFQFHKVRLKDRAGGEQRTRSYGFNSIRYD